MRDEEFVFVSDVREKKRIAHGAHNKRTHCGKGGAVKFPSDYLSRKELNAMNGEVKSYNINSPMTWKEFKALPDDIKIVYIKLLREKFGVSDSKISNMFGVNQKMVSETNIKLGIALGKHGKRLNFDAAGWNAWLNGNQKAEEIPVEETVHEVAVPVVEERIIEEATVPVVEKKTTRCIPVTGKMTFDGNVDDALETMRQTLGGAVGIVTVAWNVNMKGCEVE